MCLDRWFNNNKEFKNKIIAELAKLKNKLSTTQQNIYDIAQLTVSQNSAILNFSSFYKEAPEHGTTENQ